MIIVNGKKYETNGRPVRVKNNRVYVDGVDITQQGVTEKEIKIIIEYANKEEKSVHLDVHDVKEVIVNGSVSTLIAESCNIQCESVGGNVIVETGNVTAGKILGNVSAQTGNIIKGS